jgi:diguanylate cyclase (GGDEF)-like protein/PAS domain S-box-containing protein
MMRVQRIGARLILAVGLVAGLGLAAVMLAYGARQEASILHHNEQAMRRVTLSTVEGLTAIMLRGYAEVAHGFVARLNTVDGVIDFRILRPDGREAFVDNQTVDAVNRQLQENRFPRHPLVRVASLAIAPDDPALAQLRATGQAAFSYIVQEDGSRSVRLLEPIPNVRACRECHRAQDPLRGIVLLQSSLSAVGADVRRTWAIALSLALAGILGIGVMVWLIADHTVVKPLGRLTDALAAARQGRLDIRVGAAGSKEIDAMAASFNRMAGHLQQLYANLSDERGALSTIIRSSGDGIVLADASGVIVSANSAALTLLGRSEPEILGQQLATLIGNPDWMRHRLSGKGGATEIDHRDRRLLVDAWEMGNEKGEIRGAAITLRDVTEARRLHAELAAMAATDALTGLFNRRHFDASLSEHHALWRRYRIPLSLLLLDVDHFKQFNDLHGHECGDRVLRAIGAALRQLDDPTAIACRYGGEEMAVILPGRGAKDAMALAEAIRTMIGDLVVENLHVTVSIGVASCPPLEPGDPLTVVRHADAALYRAKERGRNRVEPANANAERPSAAA